MSFNKKFFATGGIVASSDAVCTTETTDIFGDGNGVALYSLDYDASTAQDAATDYSGTPTNVTFGVGGQINYGARFNGSSSYIAVGSPIPNTDTNAAISAWVKLSSGVSSNMHITGTGITTAASEAPFRATLSYVSANTFKIFALRQVAGTYYLASTSSLTNVTINADTWYHVVWSYNSTGRKLSTFLNGTAIDTDVAMTTSGSSVNDSSTVIGSFRSTSGPFFDGDLDQIRFFTSTLTQVNASTLYAEEACVHTATTTDENYPTTNTAYYKLDNSAEDSVSTNDGTESNIEYRFGRYGQAAVFNGSSSQISLPTSLVDSQNTFTVSLWAKTNTNTNYSYLFSFGKTTDGDALGLARASSSAISGGLDGNGLAAKELYLNTGSSFIGANFTIEENTWYHFAVSYTGTTAKIYVNGTLEETYTSTQNIPSLGIDASGNNAYIGRYIGTGFGWNGNIDQFRVYHSILTDDQVTKLYNEKPETDTSNFKTVLYDGNSSTNYISNVGMDLETNGGLVWIKRRNTSADHYLVDSVRGNGSSTYKNLSSNTTNAEGTSTPSGITNDAFEANGFIMQGSGARTNADGSDYVSWVWKGGGDASNIAVNSITGSTPSIASDVSANTEAGFSIVRHTGTSTVGTIAHGLNQAPEFIMTKSTSHDTGDGFTVYADGLAQSDSYLNLASPNIPNPNSVVWTTNAPTTDIFNVGTATGTNSSGKTYISYCWHSVSGYSKIGTYEGLGTSVVTETGLGFKPLLGIS